MHPIMKHHSTGRHSDHIIIASIAEEQEDTAELYDEDIEHEYPYEDLTRLGDGEVPYLFTVLVADDGPPQEYQYVIYLDDVTEEEYLEAAGRYQLGRLDRPSEGFYPDINYAIILIVADMLGVSVDELSDDNKKPVPAGIIAQSISEIYTEYEG